MRPATKQEAERYLAKKKLREDNIKATHKENLKIIVIICIFLLTLLGVFGIIALLN